MKAVILCGGRGTRLREVSEAIPKPMVPIGGMPIVWHIMKLYAAHGVDEFVLLLGYKGNVIRDFFVNFALSAADVTVDLSRTDAERLTFHSTIREPWKVTLVETGEETMTGGRVRQAPRWPSILRRSRSAGSCWADSAVPLRLACCFFRCST